MRQTARGFTALQRRAQQHHAARRRRLEGLQRAQDDQPAETMADEIDALCIQRA